MRDIQQSYDALWAKDPCGMSVTAPPLLIISMAFPDLRQAESHTMLERDRLHRQLWFLGAHPDGENQPDSRFPDYPSFGSVRNHCDDDVASPDWCQQMSAIEKEAEHRSKKSKIIHIF